MNLKFMLNWPDGSPTHFVEKIITSIDKSQIIDARQLLNEYAKIRHVNTLPVGPKDHTIRFLTEKEFEKWNKKGREIHFQVWEGKPYKSQVFQFAPVLPVVSLQEVEINYGGWNEMEPDDLNLKYQQAIEVVFDGHATAGTVLIQSDDKEDIEYVDCPSVGTISENDTICQLSLRDGFMKTEYFFDYFNAQRIEDARILGKKPYIIHWTNHKY